MTFEGITVFSVLVALKGGVKPAKIVRFNFVSFLILMLCVHATNIYCGCQSMVNKKMLTESKLNKQLSHWYNIFCGVQWR